MDVDRDPSGHNHGYCLLWCYHSCVERLDPLDCVMDMSFMPDATRNRSWVFDPSFNATLMNSSTIDLAFLNDLNFDFVS